MSKAGSRILEGAREALAVAKGEAPAASITVNGHRYVPADRIASLERERDEARQIVRDIHWMARRYADGRMTYAVGMFNDAVKKAFDGGWLEVSHGEPAYAVDGADRHRKPSDAEGREG